MTDNNKFARLGIIYAVGQVLSKAISFILLPIYVKQLGMTGFGQLSLIDAVFDFITSFTILGVYSGYIRFYRDYYEEELLRLKNTAMSFAFLISFLNIALIIATGKYISKVVLSFEGSYYILILVVIRSIITQLVILLMCDYALNYKARINVTINTVNLLFNLLFTIILVVYKKRGIAGIYEGYILSNLIIFIYLLKVSDTKYNLQLDRLMLKNMLKFSIGLIPSSIASTVLTLSDRYFLKGYRSLGETGIYSVGYKFGMLVQPLFINPYKEIFTPYKLQIWKKNEAEMKFNKMFINYNVIGCFILLGICVYCKALITILSTPDSIVAYKIVPFVASAYFLYGMSMFYSLGIELKNKTYLEGIVMFASGIINIILNFALIPNFGMFGAALSTATSYIFMNLFYNRFSSKLYKIRYKSTNVIKVYVVTIILYLIYYAISIMCLPIIIEMTLGVVLLFSYLVCCTYLKLIKKETITKYILSINLPKLKKIRE